MNVEVEQAIRAPRQRVWDLLTAWERQPEWMVDARAVEVLTPNREGVGVTIRCPTRVLGATVDDVMRVVDWREPERLEVVHLGRVIGGRGAFELAAVADTTVLRWWEQVEVPLGRIGELGASLLVAPALRLLFRRSLRGLASLVEHGAADAPSPR